MNIRILGAHNRESQATRHACFLIDNILAIDAGGLTSTLSLSNQKKLKAILLTHKHYDHIRDIPAIAFNLFHQRSSIEIYSSVAVRDAIETHLLNSELYPSFHRLPEEQPTLSLNLIEPYKATRIEDYEIVAVPVNHGDCTFGYQVTDAKDKTAFYTADTGPGLLECWNYVSPQLLIAEVTVPNRYGEFATRAGHLTPNFLEQELTQFQELKGYLPRIVVLHMDPILEKEIELEVAVVAEGLHTSILIAREGMQLRI